MTARFLLTAAGVMRHNMVMNYPTYLIRAAQEQDLEAYASLLADNYRAAGTPCPPYMVRDEARQHIEASLDKGTSTRLFLGVSDNQIVAMALARKDQAGRSYLVEDLYTRPAFESQGIGTALLKACENQARACRSEDIHLNVSAANKRALSFYKGRHWMMAQFNQAGQEPSYKPIDPDMLNSHSRDTHRQFLDPERDAPMYRLRKTL